MLKRVFLSLALMSSLSACVPVVVGGVAAGGKLVTQDKTIGESISDNTIWTKIKSGFVRHKLDNLLGIVNVEVHEGRVLLTGKVTDKNDILKILELTWEVDGVKEVINEIKVSNDETSLTTIAKDSWVTTKIRSKLFAYEAVKSVNYTVETIDGTVYLFGVARSKEELDTAKDLISGTDGVKKLLSYVRVKDPLPHRISNTKGQKVQKSYDDFDDAPKSWNSKAQSSKNKDDDYFVDEEAIFRDNIN